MKQAPSTPGTPRAIPCPGQAFADQLITQGMAIAHERPQLATVTILITLTDGRHVKWPLIDEFEQALRRPVAQIRFSVAARWMRLGCIDVCNPNFHAVHPDRVAVDHAVSAATIVTVREGTLLNRC